MRIKSQWFRSERPRAPGEIASAAAFIAWRIAGNAIASMRRAGFDIEPGRAWFDFLAEWLVFLIQIADRIAFVAMSPADRAEFTSALANRLGEILAENRVDLLAGPEEADGARAVKGRFIDLLNLRSNDYADFDYSDEAVDYGFLRYLADRLGYAVGERDRIWLHDQVMEIEAPDALALLRRGLTGLLAGGPARRRPRAVGD